MPNNETRKIGGICGEDASLDYDAALAEIRNDYRWTPACQRVFLVELAATGSVMRAGQHVNKTPRGAYGFRHSREGGAFRLGWDAALLIARCVIEGTLLDRAINGYEEVLHRDDDGTRWRGKFDNRLGQGLLTRLDRIANEQPQVGSMAAQIQLVSQDWNSFLDLIESGGTGAAAALFCAARSPVPEEDCETGIHRELARFSATENEAEELDLSPEEQAEQLSVWYDAGDRRWMTDFPPEDGEEAALVIQHGQFGDEYYRRTLSPAEEAVQIEAEAERLLPLHIAAHEARAAWFGAKVAA